MSGRDDALLLPIFVTPENRGQEKKKRINAFLYFQHFYKLSSMKYYWFKEESVYLNTQTAAADIHEQL